MTESSFFALLYRMKYINRWGLMRNTLPENIQEHSQVTAMLAHALAVIRREVCGFDDVSPERCALIALYHDAPEILTGDLPTPVKYFSAGIRDAYAAVERVSADRLVSLLPEVMRPHFSGIVDGSAANDAERRIVKAADRLAAYIKCVEELKSGNEEFRRAEKQTLEKVRACDLPEVDWFIGVFMPAFDKTLDELD